ncbi:MAG: regulatory iron-sulfur-containing complex subunit RicT [Ignavibacteriales bacterium]|nr:regulatory iron-sulfur-containing complex subunit RicT [Ignavibacteriales bacterium]
MFHIDPKYTQPAIIPTDDNQHNSINNSLIESIVINNINARHINVSSCFACGICYSDKIITDNRNIVEISCSGLLNNCFVEIPAILDVNLYPEDFIIVQNNDSIEVAQVKLIGEMVKLKRQYLGLYDDYLPSVVRKASVEDLERVRKNIQDEEKAVPFFRTSVDKFSLNMKLVSIHYQFDRKKLFFFYTSDGRVDFRELAKELAAEFKTRIELRQIGVRDEAKKVGGVGTCGREYCCISFLSSFKRISTQLANEQNLLSSMGKLSGPCGKLKCCLSFEVAS